VIFGEDELMIVCKTEIGGLAVNPEEIAFMDEEVNMPRFFYDVEEGEGR